MVACLEAVVTRAEAMVAVRVMAETVRQVMVGTLAVDQETGVIERKIYMIERVEFKTDGEGKVDATDKKGRVFARIPVNATVGEGMVLSSQAIDEIVDDFEEIPVKTPARNIAGKVVGAMRGSSGDLVLDICMDTEAFPDLWRGISQGWITDFSMSVAK